MSPYWSHEVCGWVPGAPLDVLDTPWAGHGLPLQHGAEPVCPDVVVRLQDAAVPEQRAVAALPVDA